MFTIPGLVCLIVFMYLRPQEHYTFLQKAPLLYLFFAATVGGLIVDIKLRLLRPVPTRTFFLALGFWAWCMLVIVLKVPGELMVAQIMGFTIVFVTYVALAQGVQSFRALHIMAGTMIAIGLFLAAVGVHQGHAAHGCVLIDNVVEVAGVPDGRPCETVVQCLGTDAEPGAVYECQRIGLFGTVAVDDRVRYRGELQDPNELALVVSATLPLLFAFAMCKRRRGWKIFAGLGAGLILLCVIHTQSRGGMLVFLAVLGVYFVKRYGMRYAVFGALAMLPLLALGGRSGAAADASTAGRYEAWRAGLYMLKADPIFGVGKGMFTQYHHLTAHNSYVLAPAELGLLGMILWAAIFYVTVKVPLVALRDFKDHPGAASAHVWALALLAMCVAYALQMMFLSLTYHTITWVLFGLSGAFYSAVKRHAPDWKVKFGLLDATLIIAACLGFLAILPVFLALKGH
jgi:hypothetical protein